jgi:hypothetical protein
VAATFGGTILSMAKSLGEMGDQVQDISIRTGLSTKEVGQFSFAMKRAGGDISSIETAMKMLSRGLADSSDEGKNAREALSQLGLRSRDVNGNLRPMSALFLEISDKLGKVGDVANRNTLALKIFGRAGLELLPDLLELSEGVEKARQMGLGMSEDAVKKLTEYQQKVVEIETAWGRLTKALKKSIVGTVYVVVKPLTEGRDKAEVLGNPFRGAGTLASGGWTTDVFGDAFTKFFGGTQDRMRAAADTPTIEAGQSILDQAKAARERTKRGVEELASKARSTATEKWNDLLAAGGTGEANVRAKQKAWQDAEAEAAKYEARLKAIGEAEKNSESVKNFLKEVEMLANVSEQPYLKETFKLLEKMGQLKMTRGQEKEALSNIWRFSLQEEAKEREVLTKEWARLEMQSYKELQAFWAAGWSEIYKGMEARTKRIADAAIELGKAGLEFRYNSAKSAATGEASTASRMATLTAITPAAGIEGAYQARVNLAEKLFSIDTKHIEEQVKFFPEEIQYLKQQELMLKARGDREKELDDAKRERALAYFELVREQENKLKETAGQIFDSLTSAGAKGLGQFITGFAKGIERTIFQNVFALAMGGMNGKLSLPGQVDGKGQLTTLGKVLKGTPFGIDPLKFATDQNTTATQANTVALGQLQASFAGGGAGGGIAAAAGAASAGNVANTATASVSKYAGLMKAIGIGSAAVGGAMGAIAGFKQGGAQGVTSGVGALAGATGMILSMAKVSGPLAPIMMGLGVGLGLVSSLFGDPKEKRRKQLEEEASTRAYTEPSGVSYDVDIYGRRVDRNTTGDARVINITVQALDAQSILDRSQDIGAAVVRATQTYPPLMATMRGELSPA